MNFIECECDFPQTYAYSFRRCLACLAFILISVKYHIGFRSKNSFSGFVELSFLEYFSQIFWPSFLLLRMCALRFTKHYIYSWDSLAIQGDNWMLLRILLSLTMVRIHELLLVNVLMILTWTMHPQAASNRTIFVHNSRKTIDHESVPSQANHLRILAYLPIFCMPSKKENFKNNLHDP